MEARLAIHGTLMRVTIHTVSAADYWPMAIGVRSARREWLHGVTAGRYSPADVAEVTAAVRAELAGGPLRVAELNRRLAARDFGQLHPGALNVWLDIVRVPPSGTWDRRSNDLYALADQWLPPDELHPDGLPSEGDGLRLLLRRYLAAFGPARAADFARWAGISAETAGRVVAEHDLRRFHDEAGRDLVDLPDAPLPDPDTPAPVRFLPAFEPILLANVRRAQVLPEAHRRLIFNTRTPWSMGTVLVDGHVAATWRYRDGRIITEALEPLGRRAQVEVEAESAALSIFYDQ
jgi:DNA glycosylase AlkZ-like